MTLCEEEREKLVKSFYNHLKQEKGLSEETASEHAHNISFFAVHYLRGYEEKSLLEVTGMDIKDYLGNWYIRKVWNSSKSDVRPILVAFKLFGLLDFGFKKDRKEYLVNHGLGIEWFTITKLGKKIFQGISY